MSALKLRPQSFQLFSEQSQPVWFYQDWVLVGLVLLHTSAQILDELSVLIFLSDSSELDLLTGSGRDGRSNT